MTAAPDTRRRGLGRRLRSSLIKAIEGAGSAVQRFPAAVVCLVALGIGVNARIAELTLVPEALQGRLMEALGAAVLFNIAVTLRVEQRAGGAAGVVQSTALTVPWAILAYLWRPFEGAGYIWQAIAALSIFCLPFVGNSTAGPWNLLMRSLLAAALAGFATLAFLSGGILLAELFRLLFDIGPTFEAYAHVVATAFYVIGPLATLGLLPTALADGASERILRPMRSFLSLVLVPMLLAALVVLHLYAVRVAIEGFDSQADMVWIVPVLILDLWLVRILADPMRGPPHIDLVRHFWPLALIVPVLLFVPAILQDASRGWTFGAYYAALIVAGGLLLGLSQLVVPLRGDLRVYFGTPALLLAFSLIGPWGAASIARDSRPVADAAPPSNGAISAFLERRTYGPYAAAPLDVTGYDRVLAVVPVTVHETSPGAGFAVRFDGPALVIAFDGRERSFDLRPMLARLEGAADEPLRGVLESDDGATIGYDLRFLTLAGNLPETGEFTLVLRQADWR